MPGVFRSIVGLIALSLVLTTELGRLHRAEAQPAGRSVPIDFVPLIDHHQHLFSSADAALVNDPPRTPRYQAPITSDDLIEMLDLAHIARAVVLSEAFWHDGPSPRSPDPYPLVRAENDWTAQQVAKYPKRLVAFCSFNPLADYALEELRRCASSKAFGGLKLGFASSGVDLSNPTHVAKVRGVFQAADGYGLPIVVHARGVGPYGLEQARVMLDQIVAAAPHIPVQIAHLWGGEGYSGDALQVYAEAVARHEPETRILYFDVAEIAFVAGNSPRIMRTIAMRIRQIGLGRILYGSDAALNGRLKPREAWELFCKKVPLTRSEFRAIAQNVAPYMR